MIKTIKVKKTKDLSELIAYISVSGIKDANFVSNYENIVSADHSGQITTVGKFYNDTFTVEVEEEITELTRFDRALALSLSAQGTRLFSHDYENLTLGKILNSNNHRDLHQVYAMINGKLKLIWEAE